MNSIGFYKRLPHVIEVLICKATYRGAGATLRSQLLIGTALLLSLAGKHASAAPAVVSVAGVADLRTLPSSYPDQVNVLAYTSGSALGGGTFNLTSCSAGITATAPSGWSTGAHTIQVSADPGMAVIGMTVTKTLKGIPDHDDVVQAYSTTIAGVTSYYVVLSMPTTSATSGIQSLTFVPDNSGSLIQVTGTMVCYKRASSDFSPYEWGAVEDGSTDDYANLQRWMDAKQPHVARPGTSVIFQGLQCYAIGYNGVASTVSSVIAGPPTQGVAEDSSYLPAFLIKSPMTGFTGTAMLTMLPGGLCGVESVGLIGQMSAQSSSSTQYDIIDAMGQIMNMQR